MLWHGVEGSDTAANAIGQFGNAGETVIVQRRGNPWQFTSVALESPVRRGREAEAAVC